MKPAVLVAALAWLCIPYAAASQSIALVPSGTPAAATDCRAYLQAASGTERSAPCGTVVEIDDAIVGWVEKLGFVTPAISVAAGGRVVAGPFTRAGEVALPPIADGAQVLIASLSDAEDALLFRRYVPSGTRVVQMPPGRAIAVAIDRRQEAIAISRPFAVAAGRRTELSFPPPASGATVIALLRRPASDRASDLKIALASDATTDSPAVMTSTRDYVVAVWYAASPGRRRLVVTSNAVHLAPADVETASRGATLFRGELQPLPKITIAVAPLSDEVSPPREMTMTLVRASDPDHALRKIELSPGQTYTLDRVPADVLDAVLSVDGFLSSKRVDLTSATDERVDFTLEPIVVTGTVSSGTSGVRAELRFLQKGQPVTVATDEEGKYRVALWRPQRYVIDVALLDRPATPPLQTVVMIDGDRTLDIHVPAMRFAVRVLDAGTQKPIAGAMISVRNTYSDPQTGRRVSNTLAFRSTEAPITELPPQRAGQSELRVHADGYEDAVPLSLNIDESVPERIVDVPLRRATDTVAVRVRLPNGAPAEGAIAASWNGDRQIWSDTASADGTLEIPRSLAGARIFVRHLAAASAIFTLDPSSDPAWQLEPPSIPLTVLVVRADGTSIAPLASTITAWIDGVPVTGEPLAFLSWSSGVTSSDGSWTGRNLPMRSLRILATRTPDARPLPAGAYAAVASSIAYPWAAPVTLQLTD